MQKRHQHLVRHVTERERTVAHLLVAPRREERLVIGETVVVATVAQHGVVALVTRHIKPQMARLQVVFIVFAQLLQRRPCHIYQLQLHLRRRHAVGKSLHNVLLARPRRLNHLVARAVFIKVYEPFAKSKRQLIDDVRLLIEIHVLPVHLLIQNTQRVRIVCSFAARLIASFAARLICSFSTRHIDSFIVKASTSVRLIYSFVVKASTSVIPFIHNI